MLLVTDVGPAVTFETSFPATQHRDMCVVRPHHAGLKNSFTLQVVLVVNLRQLVPVDLAFFTATAMALDFQFSILVWDSGVFRLVGR